MSLRHMLHTAYKSTVEAVTPARSESAFKTEGVLTPEEFVASGDYLVRTCPTWSWEAGDPAKARSYLPKDKQYLVTRNVPSSQRAAAVEGYGGPADDVMLEGSDAEEAWVAPPAEHADASHSQEAASAPALAAAAAAPHPAQGQGLVPGSGPATPLDEDDIPDLDDLELEEQDEAALPAREVVMGEAGESAEGPGDDDEVVRVRTYDVLITYDKYYQVPRSWLAGYDEARQPLQPKQVLEDVTEEHARKTVTVDPFPHTAATVVSIHPCKHAPLMKKLGGMADAAGNPFTVDTYLVLFLKFLASIIPTIEYDYTMSAGW